MVHGDDFVSEGENTALDWLAGQASRRFEIKTHQIGMGEKQLREHRILGRIVRATSDGWEYEADPRHAEVMVKVLGLEGANGVKTPGEEEKSWEAEENVRPLSVPEAREYRGLAARANYLGQDRADICYAAKEACRGMAAPTLGDWKALRRLARYLVHTPRVVWHYAWQKPESELSVFTDSDWAGCRRTARSTSGGYILLGAHPIKGYSVTQRCVTLSSGEAELMALVKASSEAIGVCQMAEGWGMKMSANVHADSSAAIAVTDRKGCGKLRHVRIGHLWVQELAERQDVRYVKVRGDANPADLFTKHLSAAKLAALMPKTSQVAQLGEASARLRLKALGHMRPLCWGTQAGHLGVLEGSVSHAGPDRRPGDSTNFWPSTPAASGQGGVLINGSLDCPGCGGSSSLAGL